MMRQPQSVLYIIGLMLFLPIILLNSAHASDWYTAEFCTQLLGTCTIRSCELSDISPAQLYENNKAYADSKIIDQDERVDVVAQGARLTFFHTVASCKKFVAERTQIYQQHEQEQQNKLNKYR